MLAGIAPGISPQSQVARRLAENGLRVLVPHILDRRDNYSSMPGRAPTNQPHREWIYRQAFEMGRHIIGYEVQKILAAVDWFKGQSQNPKASLGLFGYGVGGLLALYAGAIVGYTDGHYKYFWMSRLKLLQSPQLGDTNHSTRGPEVHDDSLAS